MATFFRFRTTSGQERYGLLEGERVIALLEDILGDWKRSEESFALEEVKLLAPCTPSKAVCVGTNYRAALAAKGQPVPAGAVIFLRPASAVIGTGLPKGVGKLGYEAELLRFT